MKIAIIGAGVSGLATAYNLKKLIPSAEIHIYEKGIEVGGNANTINVNLPTPSGNKIRWVDMGVNDFNKATYDNLVAFWKELKIMDQDGNSDYCRPLLNNASFAFSGSNYRYSVENNGEVAVPTGGVASKINLQKGKDDFIKEIAAWYKLIPDEEHAPRTSVGEWAEAPGRFPGEFVHSNLYPRINGMYFTQEQNPQNIAPPSVMPLWMVAHYYILQEGYTDSIQNGDDLWTRQYFKEGSSRWLKFLARKLKEEMGVDIILGANKLHVNRYKGRMTVYNGEITQDSYDKVIFATHADDTYDMIDFKNDDDAMIPALKKFTYDTSTAYVHQDKSYIPLDGEGNCNKTYNIHIYDYNPSLAHKWPYTITYIVNYHQNDQPLDKDPLFFITLNPYKNNGAAPKNLLKRTEDGKDAIATFKHCKLDVAAMDAQVAIDKMQLGKDAPVRDFYYVGSFSVGAGLHEECIIKAQELAKKIASNSYVSNEIYDFSGERHFAPQYIMNIVNRK
ncbi:MAG: NAD(P)-binding protein [Bacteroidota bacterium]